MSMSIPVYLFTGFLDAGKTAFIQETLEDPGFNTGEKTLVLLCEEGENEYRPERFAGGNVSFLPVEEQAGLTTAFLKDYQKKHRVDRVLIEYNGMWPLQALYDALPTDWDIYQIILLADSTTFASYMTNMRQLAVEKMQEPDVVIFNRVTQATDKATLHRAVRMVNRRAQILFETVDGEVEYDVRPGTQTDTKVRLKGKGVPSLRSRSVRGDHYVTLVVQVPERMNQAQKEALRRFEDAMNGVASPEEEKPKKKGIFK